jgi:type IV pilus assembly protein PilQ
MVKVGSMKRAQRIVLIASVLLASVGGAHASLFGRHKAKAPQPAPPPPPAAMSLSAIDVESTPSPRLVLRTSASPVFTSYNKTADTFVVDLTGTSKASALVVPTTLPAGVSGISADEVTEMGSRFTRVTVRFGEANAPKASAEERSVVIALPNPPAAVAAIEPLPTVVASAVAAPPPAPVVAEPVIVTEPLPAAVPSQKAKTLKTIEANGRGDAVEVALATDGDVTYKAFKLEKPARVVIDLDGVRNAVAKSSIAVSDAVVSRVRVSQFTPTVTRVVLDLGTAAAYHVTKSGDRLRVTFGDSVAVAPPPAAAAPVAVASAPVAIAAPAPVAIAAAPSWSGGLQPAEPAPKPEAPKPPATVDVPAQVPVVAENVSTWKMPEPKPARSVINAPAAQAPPSTTPPKKSRKKPNAGNASSAPTPVPATAAPAPSAENVFTEGDAQQPMLGSNPTPGQTNLSGGGPATAAQGGRTLNSGEKVYTGEPLSLTLKDADIKDVIRTFAQLTGLNIAVDPQVTGFVTVDFVDVPWDQALEIILRQNSLAYVLEGNVMRVGTIARLAEEAQATRRLEEEKRLNVPTQTIAFKLSYARAGDVSNLLHEMASPRARIIVDARTNQLIVSEIPSYLQIMQRLIESVDVATKQVIIEARIVETSKTFLQQYGFNWNFRGKLDPSLGTGTGLVFPNSVDIIGGPFQFGPGNPVVSFSLANVLGTFTLDFALNAAETEGLARVISAPRVMTQDNVSAEIQSGFQIPYQTRVNFTTTIAYVDATLRLAVTPQVTEAGTVIMDIQVQKNEPATGLAIEGGAGTPLVTRQARTRLMVRDGGTTVIAGIYQTKDNNAQTRLPFLHQVPILGALFRTHNINSTHDELLIFITPRIVRSS